MLSQDYVTLVVTVFIGEYETESQLINYNLDGKIMGNLKISYDEINTNLTKREAFLNGNNITITDITLLDSEKVTTSYQIEANGKIYLLSEWSTESFPN